MSWVGKGDRITFKSSNGASRLDRKHSYKHSPSIFILLQQIQKVFMESFHMLLQRRFPAPTNKDSRTAGAFDGRFVRVPGARLQMTFLLLGLRLTVTGPSGNVGAVNDTPTKGPTSHGG